VGISPIVFFANRSNSSGLGAKDGSGNYYFNNLTLAQAQALWSGANCNTSAFGVSGAPSASVTVNAREPLSGTMNTTEFQVFQVPYVSSLSSQNSQEKNVNPTLSTDNPLNLTCTSGGGARKRAIGTGQMVNTAVKNNADSLGYAFFGFGNFSQLAGNASYGYLKLAGVDPIYNNNTYSTGGLLPVCQLTPTYSCPALSTLFGNLKSGSYPAWSDLRIVTDSAGSTVASSISSKIQSDLTSGTNPLPDFVPFSAVTIYRSHYGNGYTNGSESNGLSGAAENGGDMNGCIETSGNVLDCMK
jgi:ABC-type phosphate transport system substrate-binding protein